jgi:hypothetical protein
VVVSVVHVRKGPTKTVILNERKVYRISAYLIEGGLDDTPKRLASNSRKVLIGSYALGTGFVFDDIGATKGVCESLATRKHLIDICERSAHRIKPFIGGNDVTTDPRQGSHRFIIDFRDIPLHRDARMPSWSELSADKRTLAVRQGIVSGDYPGDVASDWPDLLEIVKRRVLPQRNSQGDASAKTRWWKFKRPNMYLYDVTSNYSCLLVRSLTSAHFTSFTVILNKYIVDQTLLVFVGPVWPLFSSLCSRIHKSWVTAFSGTLQ